jgi:cell division cycle 2-like
LKSGPLSPAEGSSDERLTPKDFTFNVPTQEQQHFILNYLLTPENTMSTRVKSRWAADDDPDTEAQRKREKEEKKRAKREKQQRRLQELHPPRESTQHPESAFNGEAKRPAKRRRLSEEGATSSETQLKRATLRFPCSEWGSCRHVDNFERLNRIEEGSYGLVSRARDIATDDIVALKKLKMDNSPDGFPVTGLREIQMLMRARHKNIVHLREIVMGEKMDE